MFLKLCIPLMRFNRTVLYCTCQSFDPSRCDKQCVLELSRALAVFGRGSPSVCPLYMPEEWYFELKGSTTKQIGSTTQLPKEGPWEKASSRKKRTSDRIGGLVNMRERYLLERICNIRKGFIKLAKVPQQTPGVAILACTCPHKS